MIQQTIKRERVTGKIVQLPDASQQHKDRIDIWNHAAERAVISAVLQVPEVYASVSEILQPGDFHETYYGYVWHSFDRITGRGDPIDMITVADDLDVIKFPSPEGYDGNTALWLAQVASTADRAESAEAYARMVRDSATRMRMIIATDAIKRVAGDRSKYYTIEAAVDEANRLLFAATDQQIKMTDTSMAAAVQGFMDAAEMVRGGGVVRGVGYGYPNIDALLRVSVPGEVSVIAGAPKMGKTTFCLCAARNLALEGKRIAIFTLEQQAQELVSSFTAMETGIAKRAFKGFDLTPKQWLLFNEAMGRIGNWGIHMIDEFPALTPIQLRRRLRTMIQHQRIPLDLVIIDGLWLMQYIDDNGKSLSRTEDRPAAVGYILRDLINVARDFNIPIWITHQYNGDANKRNDKRPRLSDLAESSGAQRNAQVIMGLYRDAYYGITGGTGLTEVHVLADRNGSDAQGQYAEFQYTPERNLFTPFGRVNVSLP